MRSRSIEPLIAGAALGMFLYATLGSAAQFSTPHKFLLALSKRNHTLTVVDPATLRVIARTPVGPDPHEVIASSDGKTAYVSISTAAVDTMRFPLLILSHRKRCPTSIPER
jgi:DNA-binding beta-propeller fold protein YncE